MTLPSSIDLNYPFESETPRLILRPTISEDVSHWINFMNDPIALEHFHGFDAKDAEANAQNWINKILERYREGRYGLLSLVEKGTESYVGQCGLLTQEVDGKLELEIGYSLLQKHWRKGYATEAASYFKNWAFDRKLSSSIVSLIHVDNEPSKKVAERNGMRPDFETTWRDLPIVVFRVNNPNSDL